MEAKVRILSCMYTFFAVYSILPLYSLDYSTIVGGAQGETCNFDRARERARQVPCIL